ncbi:hypothetical protein V502_10207, partial [Pseudogymnoascus sp. VKM F-4520 (FW-2644)]
MSTNMYQDPEADLSDGPPSSPFVANVINQSENTPPAKQDTASPSPTPASRNSVTSPLKMLKIRSIQSDASTPSQRSPRKISSPDRRFPVKVAPLSPSPETQPTPQPTPQAQPRQIQETTLTINDVLRDNEGLTRAIQILEDEGSDDGSNGSYADAESGFDDTALTHNGDDEGFADETAFSAFSAVPDMTMYAQIGHTPSKSLSSRQPPNLASSYTPATLRRPMMRQEESSPTPRRDYNDTTNIIDFTEQFNNFSTARHSYESPLRNQSTYTSTNSNSSSSSARTPSPN